jgi:transcription initiation factor IIE alpha subunit
MSNFICPGCQKPLEYLLSISSFVQEVSTEMAELSKPDLIERHFQCPLCGESLDDEDMKKAFKNSELNPKIKEIAQQGGLL